MQKFDVVIIGSGPAGLGAAFELVENSSLRILMVDRGRISSGGLRNDCKQNYTFPVGFPHEYWVRGQADELLSICERHLSPEINSKSNISMYRERAAQLNVELLDIRQAHVGTDRASALIGGLIKRLEDAGVEVRLEYEALSVDCEKRVLVSEGEEVGFDSIVIAPGRAGSAWLQKLMSASGVRFVDNTVDIGVRVEAHEANYRIVNDYYDPKFLFPDKVRTFCTNSGCAHVVREKYEHYYSVNGHSLSRSNAPNNLVNFAMLRTVQLTDPVVSGQHFADILGQMAMQLSGGQPMMQRVGDFRSGKRSKSETFNHDLYDFKPTLSGATPGDISLAMPSKILRNIWSSLKRLDTIVPGILHPSTILYYPEIKTYSNRPEFINEYFAVRPGIFLAGDGAGTSRGITAAWASGVRAARGICREAAQRS